MFKNMQTCHGKFIDVQKHVTCHGNLRCSKTRQTCHVILKCSKPFANLPQQTKDVQKHGKYTIYTTAIVYELLNFPHAHGYFVGPW